MTAQQVLAWVQIGQIAMNASVATAEQITSWIKGQSPNITDADLNAILAAIAQSAALHQAIADADVAATK